MRTAACLLAACLALASASCSVKRTTVPASVADQADGEGFCPKPTDVPSSVVCAAGCATSGTFSIGTGGDFSTWSEAMTGLAGMTCDTSFHKITLTLTGELIVPAATGLTINLDDLPIVSSGNNVGLFIDATAGGIGFDASGASVTAAQMIKVVGPAPYIVKVEGYLNRAAGDVTAYSPGDAQVDGIVFDGVNGLAVLSTGTSFAAGSAVVALSSGGRGNTYVQAVVEEDVKALTVLKADGPKATVEAGGSAGKFTHLKTGAQGRAVVATRGGEVVLRTFNGGLQCGGFNWLYHATNGGRIVHRHPSSTADKIGCTGSPTKGLFYAANGGEVIMAAQGGDNHKDVYLEGTATDQFAYADTGGSIHITNAYLHGVPTSNSLVARKGGSIKAMNSVVAGPTAGYVAQALEGGTMALHYVCTPTGSNSCSADATSFRTTAGTSVLGVVDTQNCMCADAATCNLVGTLA